MNYLRFIASCFLIVLVLPACHRATEQDKIKKIITEARKAAEEREIKTILGHLSKTYRDPQGYDYEGIKGLLLFYFYRHQTVSVYIPHIDISVSDNSAKAIFQAVLTGGSKAESVKDLLPDALGVYDFDVTLVKESGGWRVTSAKWERTGQGQPDGIR